ncbi:isopenicillin N synthase family dioxygenase [Dongia rigui]|uniref:2-oxoglutarate-dependent ethylene/succinate-forming enzyme n=1 Tax=Dongia rigui TaxID=940149 RepID=A0ABU5E3W2_9PROT|nr:2OG-Fe(II) oxygenase family protein [Dongia rigui]MDY0874228.1 2OG-Fe(II) oxygenase family protein [Dongia rigui]
MILDHLPPPVPVERLLRLFDLPPEVTHRLWRQKFAPGNSNVYRGWFPLQDGRPTYKEGLDSGPDIAHGATRVRHGDPLTEATPLPPEAILPGWQADMACYYRAMEVLGLNLLRSIARALGLPEETFTPAFDQGISTLRLLHYPVRPAHSFIGVEADKIWTTHQGRAVDLVAAPHVDSGFITLLRQHGVSGLQALGRDGAWHDVPPRPDSLVVNFGKLLERWTGGRIKATKHRVIGAGSGEGRARHSIAFFFEPAVDALIAPINQLEGEFDPFLYGDLVWDAMMKFVEFEGLDHLRQRT